MTETVIETETTNPVNAKDTLFYDGQCPLCASEIEQLRSLRGDTLELVDIHCAVDASASAEAGAASSSSQAASTDSCESGRGAMPPSKDQLLRTLHLRRVDGSWITGADANVAAWEGSRMAPVWRVLRWPLIRIVVDFVYARWALWRYRRLYGEQFDEQKHAP